MARLRALATLLPLTLFACGGPPSPERVDDGVDERVADAVVRRDGGVRGLDGGAGPRRDAGTADAGVPDASPTQAALYFQGYNAGLGTAYLSQPHTVGASGDARYTSAARHVHRAGVAYGPNPRNLLDAWILPSPSPIAVFIHGGGFNRGSRDDIHSGDDVARLLAAGISVATISYRWGYEDPALAAQATNPDAEGSTPQDGARVDYILRDCACAIQFLRYRAADWGLDASRIAAWGPSAGGGCATWIDTIDDLALPEHADPVLRQSSRIRAAGHLLGQPTYDWTRWAELLRMDEAYVEREMSVESSRLSWHLFPELRLATDLRRVLDDYAAMGPGDGAFYTQNLLPDVSQAQIRDPFQLIHHPRAHVALYERCAAAGLDCEIDTRGLRRGTSADVIEFLIRQLGP